MGEAVDAAEELTGLQLCVCLGPAEGDARARAEALFVEAGLQLRPAVLLLVAPDQRRVEIVTSPAVRERVPDAACADAVSEMTTHFAAGRMADGIIAGVQHLAAVAGPGEPAAGDEELPDLLG